MLQVTGGSSQTSWCLCLFLLQSKENRTVNERLTSMETSHTAESEKMRTELSRLKGYQEEAKNKTNQVSSLQEELEKLKKELSVTQQEKKTIEDWAQTYRSEMEKVRPKTLCCLFFFFLHFTPLLFIISLLNP